MEQHYGAITYNFDQKSTVEDIRATFDRSVDRFSNMETGQQAAMDSRLIMDHIAAVAARTTPHAKHILDIGCGAGNYTLALLRHFQMPQHLPELACTLLDLSAPMLERAKMRVEAVTPGTVTPIQGDIREIELGEARFDVVLAGSALHHLRQDHEWEQVFAKVYRSLKPRGSFWISDLIIHEHPGVQAEMWDAYETYLLEHLGPEARDAIFAKIEYEDTPRSVTYQLDMLQQVGFCDRDILHKNACFAAFGGVKK